VSLMSGIASLAVTGSAPELYMANQSGEVAWTKLYPLAAVSPPYPSVTPTGYMMWYY
jgi:hypothetical protein